jgi:protein tyrosine phosphatase
MQFHCCHCGQVFCKECCHQRRRVASLGEHTVLVCESCVVTLDSASASSSSGAAATASAAASSSAAPAPVDAVAADAPVAAADGEQSSSNAIDPNDIEITVGPLSSDEEEANDLSFAQQQDAASAAAAAAAAAAYQEEESVPRFQFPSDIGQDITDVRAHVLRLLQPVVSPIGVPIDGFDVEYEYMTFAQREALDALDFSSALAEPNLGKNRYSNILPPDHSRVLLTVRDYDPCSDYINANSLDGQSATSAGRYISCQGPLETTFADFWRMVWEQRSSVVLMLTREIEKGFIKCDRYWPEPGAAVAWDEEDEDGAGAYVPPGAQETADDGTVSAVYGDVRVTHVSVEAGDEYLVRTFELEHLVEQEKRTLTHYQYTGWPDHGIPASRAGFLQLVQLADQANNTQGPLTVHCFRETDHQLLTNRGFMFLDEVEAHVERGADGRVVDWRGLRVASYAPDSERLVYAQPHALVINASAADMIEIASSHAEETRWHAAGADADKCGDGVSLVATMRHDMWARTAKNSKSFAKVPLDELVLCDTVELLARAAGGVDAASLRCADGVDGEAAAPPPVALHELYGFWLARGGEFDAAAVVVVARTAAERAFVSACTSGLDDVVEVECADGAVLFKLRELAACFAGVDGGLAPWLWRLSGEALQAVVRGFGGAPMRVVSARMRDQLVQLLLHAGYAPLFEACGERAWLVSFDNGRVPRLSAAQGSSARLVRKCASRSWCFDMRGGFVVVRRAMRDASGQVAQASRPTVQGNCSAGVGRTGTFCAVHSALENFQAQLNDGITAPAINILQCVMAMRARRPGMVQTKEQYIFAYLAVLEQTEQWLFERGLLTPDANAAASATETDDAAPVDADGTLGAEEVFDAAEPVPE